MGNSEGAFIPEMALTLMLKTLGSSILKIMQSLHFKKEFDQLLKDYVGRPFSSIFR